MSILRELRQATGVKEGDLLTLALAANRLTDQQWVTLSTNAQDWVNTVLVERDVALAENREVEVPPPVEPVSIQLQLSAYPNCVAALLDRLLTVVDVPVAIVVNTKEVISRPAAKNEPAASRGPLSSQTRRRISAAMKRHHAKRKHKPPPRRGMFVELKEHLVANLKAGQEVSAAELKQLIEARGGISSGVYGLAGMLMRDGVLRRLAPGRYEVVAAKVAEGVASVQPASESQEVNP